MNQIDIREVERLLEQNPYSKDLLSLISRHYQSTQDSARLLNLVNLYMAKIDCPSPIKLHLAEACYALHQYASIINLLQNDHLPASLILKAKAYLAQNELQFAMKCYQDAVLLDATVKDPVFEKQLGLDSKGIDTTKTNVVLINGNRKTNASEKYPGINISFKDVGGLHEVKKQITRRIIAPFKNPSIFQKFKRRIGGGILLYGPPGCGKTLLARATAGECEARFFNVMLTDILSKWVGESESNLHSIFEEARKSKPSIIFFDEIEAIASNRTYNQNNRTSDSLVSLLLTELDGFNQNNDGLLILAATNVPWAIDSAFRRPGRFDRQIFIPPPNFEARQIIISNLLKDKPVAENLDIDLIAMQTSGFSGADLKHLIETAEDEIIDQLLSKQNEVVLEQSMIEIALKEIKPTTLEWLATIRNYVEYANDTGNYDEVKEFLKTYAKSK